MDAHSFEDVGGNPFSGLGLGFDTKTHFLKASFPLLTRLETVCHKHRCSWGTGYRRTNEILLPILFNCRKIVCNDIVMAK